MAIQLPVTNRASRPSRVARDRQQCGRPPTCTGTAYCVEQRDATSCVCLGKPELQALYITTARKFLGRVQLRSKPVVDGVLAVEVNVRGIV
jgi:hypothetical protein